jgi:hypothetical protein
MVYGDYYGTTVDFLDVTEESTTDLLPLYRAPIHFGNQFYFFPNPFNSSSSGVGSDTTEGVLTMTLQAADGFAIKTVTITEYGNYALTGDGTAATFANVSGTLEVGSQSTPLLITPSGPYLLANVASGPFTGSAVLNFTGQGITQVSFSLTNTLETQSEGGTTSYIGKSLISDAVAVEIYTEPICNGPVTSGGEAVPNPVQVASTVNLTALVEDTDYDIASAEYSLDGGSTWSPMDATDGSFNDEKTEEVIATLTAPEIAGVYEVLVRGTSCKLGEAETFFLTVYDPEGGFVTGGGWIWSPPGAYISNPDLEGKANFGFVSKYKSGAEVPTGNTLFKFKVADFTFKSNDYEWLVVHVANAKAMYQGTGTINGVGNYRFKLSAIDADINENDSHEFDRFRIKIWDESSGTVEYDNAIGADDDFDDFTELSGGSIVIHKQ